MAKAASSFRKPSRLERLFNRVFGALVGFGFGRAHNYVLQVRGRKSGRMYATPVNLLVLDGKKYLIAPRGNTEWVRNARASGEIWLKRGKTQDRFCVRELRDEDKPRLLKSYLDLFRTTVQRYFPIPAGSDSAAFLPIASRYPVFELQAVRE